MVGWRVKADEETNIDVYSHKYVITKWYMYKKERKD